MTPMILTADRALSHAELTAAAARVRFEGDAGHATPLIAHPSLDTVIAIAAALDQHRPIALLHPRAAAADLAAQRAALARHPVPPGTLAVLFTSGSTGAPRGVVLSRAAATAAAAASAANLGWRDDDRWLLCLPLAHAGGLGVVLRCLAARRPIVLHDAPFDAAAVARLAISTPATLASLVPTQLAALLDAPMVPGFRAVVLGGAAAAPALLARAAARGVRFVRSYGLTETWGQVATTPLARAGDPDAPILPLPGVTLAAGTADAPAPIAIHTPTAMTGYLGEAPLAAGVAITTSDLGWLDETSGLHVLGRADDVIVTGGEKVHPAQVEAAVAGAPGVAAAAAIGLPDDRWGQIVACAIVPTAGCDLPALHAWLAAHLPPQLRPRRLTLIDALPLLPTGKIDRRALAGVLAGA